MNQHNKTGVFISELRKANGLSQEELGSMLHLTKKAVSRWETGRGLPDSSILLPLSKALGVSVDEILKGEFALKEDIDAENKKKIEKMNAVFEYLTEKKLLVKKLLVYTPILAFTSYLAIEKFQNKNNESILQGVNPDSFSLQYWGGLQNNSNGSYINPILLIIFLAIGIDIFWQLFATLKSYVKTKQSERRMI